MSDLDQGPANCFYKQSFTGTQPRTFSSVLSGATFPLQWQSAVAATETAWPAKPTIFTIWPFTEEVC